MDVDVSIGLICLFWGGGVRGEGRRGEEKGALKTERQ